MLREEISMMLAFVRTIDSTNERNRKQESDGARRFETAHMRDGSRILVTSA
jgi:hypothetical protein